MAINLTITEENEPPISVTITEGIGVTTGGGSTTVIDDLTSTSATSALSANQGRVLDEGKASTASVATVQSNLTTHENAANPHNVSASQVGLGNVENTALSTWTGNTSQSSVGTITTGTWQGTAIAVANGGTGATTLGDAVTNLRAVSYSTTQTLTDLQKLKALSNIGAANTGADGDTFSGPMTFSANTVWDATATFTLHATAKGLLQTALGISSLDTLSIAGINCSGTVTATNIGTIAAFAGNQNLQTTDNPTFGNTTAGWIRSGVGISVNGLLNSQQNGVGLSSSQIFGWSSGTLAGVNLQYNLDTQLFRNGASGAVGLGKTAGATDGALSLANLTASGAVTGGSLTVDGSSTNNIRGATAFGSLYIGANGTTSTWGGLIAFGASTTLGSGIGPVLLGRRNGLLEVRLGSSSGPLALEVDANSGNLTASGTVKTGAYTVATLPTPSAGMRAYVTDANATTYLSTVAGGGANVVPVFYDGTNWKIA